MNCPKCNMPIDDSMHFCPQCGNNLQAASVKTEQEVNNSNAFNTEKQTEQNPAPSVENANIPQNNQPYTGPQPNANANYNPQGNANAQNHANQAFGGFCKNCGAPLIPNISMCPHCGSVPGAGNHFCQNCGKAVDARAAVCINCGYSLNQAPPFVQQKSRVAAGLLGIFLGGFGAHNFYLGNTDKAIIQLIICIVGIVLTCLVIGAFMIIGAYIWGLVEGIMILTGSIRTDAKGVPLRD